MAISFKGKIRALQNTRVQKMRNGSIFLFFGICILIFYYLNEQNIRSNPSFSFALIVIALLLLYIAQYMIRNPLPKDKLAFLKIAEAIDILQLPGREDQNLTDASKLVMKISDILEELEPGDAEWYNQLKKEEKKLIRLLRERVAPSILEGFNPTSILTDLLYALNSPDPEIMYTVNKSIEKYIDEKEVIKMGVSSLLSDVFQNNMFKWIISFILAVPISLLFVYIGCILFNSNYNQYLQTHIIEYFMFLALISGGLEKLFSNIFKKALKE